MNRNRQKRSPKSVARRAESTQASLESRAIGSRLPIIATALLLISIIFTTVHPLIDPDTWFHLAFGRQLIGSRSFPYQDLFSHTARGSEWISSGWLSSVGLFAAYRAGGEGGAGLIAFVVIVACLAYGATLLWSLRRGGPETMWVVCALIAGVGLAGVRLNPRPDLFSQLFVPLLVLLLADAERVATATGESSRRRMPRTLWLVPCATVLWANLHSGFLAGLILILIHLSWLCWRIIRAGEQWRLAWFLPEVASLFVWMANPYGWRIMALAEKIRRIPNVTLIMEWMPFFKPGFAMPWPAYLFGAVMLLLFAAVAVRSWRAVPGWLPIAGAFLFLMAVLQRRQTGLVASGIPAILAAMSVISGEAPALLRRTRSAFIGALGLSIAVCFAQVSGGQLTGKGLPGTGLNCTYLPCNVADFLAQTKPTGAMFNSYAFGGYFVYHLAPDMPVFIDGRLDIYDPKVWADSLAVEENRIPPEEIESRYGVRVWVLQVDDAYGDPGHLASRLAARPDYALVHFDDRAAVFVKRSPESEAYVRAHGYAFVSPWKLDSVASAMHDPSRRDAAAQEIDRALEQSNGSATANIIAAVAARAAGDQEGAAMYADTASARVSRHPLLPQARGR